MLGIVSIEYIYPVLLASLGILCISVIKGEHNFQKLFHSINKEQSLFKNDFPSTMREQIINAEDLFLIGVTLSRTIKTYNSAFIKKVKKGERIRVLLIDPVGPAVDLAETRNYGRMDPNRTRQEIKSSINDLLEIKKYNPGYLSIRTIKNPLTHGVISINPHLSGGILFLENYPYKTIGGSIPKFILQQGIDYWYDFFLEEAEILWNHGKEVQSAF